ncbi:MAG: exodeoxyribonuclease VII large subunit [Deltaproteobacteria bacterium]|jgi:exodeoxyribonuclease VII large subunit|nr:exodeoxyribonuclease VII large subunit [Deltaproteobacteria bacterium]
MSQNLFQPQILTPTLVARRIQTELDQMGQIQVEGEITGLTRASSGHVYFQIKDKDANLKAVVWRGQANRSNISVAKNGLMVVASGNLVVYQPRSEYQMVVLSIKPQGDGALRLAFEKLKNKLQTEGLFDIDRKRQVSLPPHRVAVLTSEDSAACQDFFTTAVKRFKSVNLSLYPVRVQGKGAAEEMAEALADLNNWGGFDLVVITRGGGSLEDLWAFNEEVLIRAVSSSRLPVLAAIGHSTDLSLTEMAADLKAITPTGAAEMLFPDDSIRLRLLDDTIRNLKRAAQSQLSAIEASLKDLRRRLVQSSASITSPAQTVDELEQRLKRASSVSLGTACSRLREAIRILELKSPHQEIKRRHQEHSRLSTALLTSTKRLLDSKQANANNLTARLGSVSPLKVLERGYAVVTGPDDRVVRRASVLSPGDAITVRLSHGSLTAAVTGTDSSGVN